MRNVTYKYSVGDYIRFKSKFTNPTCGLVGREGEVVEITGIAPAYNCKPCYYINGDTSTVYYERIFEGRVD